VRFPELPSARVDAWAIALGVVGFGFLMVPHEVISHGTRWAVVSWIGAVLVFVIGFPAVQRTVNQRRQMLPRSPLVVLFGKIEPFRSVATLRTGLQVQHARVIVKNAGPTATARAVRAYCELHQPRRYDRWLLSGPFDLHAGEEKIVDVVSWNAGRDGAQFRLGDPDSGLLLDAVDAERDVAETTPLGYVATIVIVAEGLPATRAQCFFGLLEDNATTLTLSPAGSYVESSARLSA